MAGLKLGWIVGALVAGGAVWALSQGMAETPWGERDQPAAEATLAAQAAVRQADVRVPRSAAEVSLSFAPVARAVRPAVVNVFTAKVVQDRVQLSPWHPIFRSQPRVENSLGSGVIVDPSGLVVTNAHVVGGADQIIVALADRREFPAKILFVDRRLDLALLKVDPGEALLPSLGFADSDTAEVGDLVLAVGNPFGLGQTVTQGIVSAVARSGVGVSDAQYFIQTDAAINRGNSGGALVNLSGELLGINTQIITPDAQGGSVGIGFAVPSNMVRLFLRAAGSGKLVLAWLGVDGEALTAETSRQAGLDLPSGVRVTDIYPSSPAARAGLRPGDVIVGVDGRDVADPSALRYVVSTRDPESQVTLSVIRDRQKLAVPVRLALPPENPPRAVTQIPAGNILSGVTIANLSPAYAQELGVGLPDRGVVVTAIDGGAVARRLSSPRPGDVIEAVNGRPVGDVKEVIALLQASPERTLFRINRSGQKQECLFEAPRRFTCAAA